MPEQSNINPVLNERWFKWANWWVRYNPVLKKITVIGVVTIEAVLILYSGYVWIDYFIISRNSENVLYEELTRSENLQLIRQIMSPKPVVMEFTATLPAGGSGGSYDVIAKLSNPNQNFLAMVSYQFITDGKQWPVNETLILNNEERYVIGAGLASSPRALAELVITAVRWQRLREWAKLNERKPRFNVSDVSFTPVADERSGYNSLGRVDFTITNESGYNFWTVDLTIILYKGEQMMAARYTTLEQIRSAEKRPVSLNIYNISSPVDKILVVPMVNITDPSVFMSVPGQSTDF